MEQHAAQSPEVSLVLQEESSDCSVATRPILHSISQHLHRHLVTTQIIAHKQHLLHILHTHTHTHTHTQ